MHTYHAWVRWMQTWTSALLTHASLSSLLLLIKHLTVGNQEFIQLNDSWKGAYFVLAKSRLHQPVCVWSPVEICVTQQGFCILEGTWEAQGVLVSVVWRWTYTRSKGHLEPNVASTFCSSSRRGSRMEHTSCDRGLHTELLHLLFCFCQSCVTHMVQAGLWPGPLQWFTVVSIFVHSSQDINPCPVGFVLLPCLFSSFAFALLALLDPSAAIFIYATNGWRQEMQNCVVNLSLNMLHYVVMFVCLTHPAVETHTRPFRIPAEL